MARKAKPAAEVQPNNFNHEQMADDIQKINALALMNTQISENAQTVAAQLGYDGALTVGALEDEIRFYQRRTAEVCLELGKRLLILKELTPHGEFIPRVELLGLSRKTAQRFMQATAKFSKSDKLTLLAEKIGTQSKLLELVTQDDDELEQLADGASICGLTLDDIETMTVSELKAVLRETRANYESSGRLLAEKSAHIDKLATKLMTKEKRVTTLPPDEVAEELRKEASLHSFAVEAAILGSLRPALLALTQHGGEHAEFMTGLVAQAEIALLQLREEFHLTKASPSSDTSPDWHGAEADAAIAKFANYTGPAAEAPDA